MWVKEINTYFFHLYFLGVPEADIFLTIQDGHKDEASAIYIVKWNSYCVKT
jgi:hypothetical protein